MGTIFLVLNAFFFTCIYIIYSVTKILRKIRATTFTDRLWKIMREGPGGGGGGGAPGMSNAASN